MWTFPNFLEEGPSESFEDYNDTWKMINLNEFFFREFFLLNGPFRSNDWEQQLWGENVMRHIDFKY